MGKYSGDRRKDYVAHLAVGLFVVIVVMEILLVTWLPRKMITEKLWEREEALQETLALMDTMRNSLRRGINFKDKWQEGEVGMALECLDEIATYMRKYQDVMSREDIKKVYDVLQKFDKHHRHWAEGGRYVSFERIDIEPLLRKSLDKYNGRNKKNK